MQQLIPIRRKKTRRTERLFESIRVSARRIGSCLQFAVHKLTEERFQLCLTAKYRCRMGTYSGYLICGTMRSYTRIRH